MLQHMIYLIRRYRCLMSQILSSLAAYAAATDDDHISSCHHITFKYVISRIDRYAVIYIQRGLLSFAPAGCNNYQIISCFFSM